MAGSPLAPDLLQKRFHGLMGSKRARHRETPLPRYD